MKALPEGVTIIVPVYYSEKSVGPLVERLGPVLAGLGKPYEVILVEDGSEDDSWAVIQQLTERYPWVRGIKLMRNYGQHNALLCGIRQALFATTITMDDDLQHPPEELPKMLAALTPGVDVVYGRPASEQHSILRNLASQLTKWALYSVTRNKATRDVSALRIFRTQLRDGFENYSSAYVSIDVLLTWSTRRFSSIAVNHVPRPTGVSNYTFRKLVVHALNMMTGFSALPLQVASVIGLSLTVFGVGVLVYVFVSYLVNGGSVSGFPFLASIISIFSGAQLFSLGIIGEYLARMHFRSMNKPAYVVRDAEGGETYGAE